MYLDPWTSIFKSHIVYFQCVRSFPKSHIFQLLIFARVSFPYDRLRIRVKRAGANICMCRPAHGLTENPCVACRHREIETNRSSKSYACDRCIADITKLIRIGKWKETRENLNQDSLTLFYMGFWRYVNTWGGVKLTPPWLQAREWLKLGKKAFFSKKRLLLPIIYAFGFELLPFFTQKRTQK